MIDRIFLHGTWHEKIVASRSGWICVHSNYTLQIAWNTVWARISTASLLLTTQHRTRHLALYHRRRTIKWRWVLFTGESFFCLWSSDDRRRVRWWPGERCERDHFTECHTGLTPGIIVCYGIMFDSRTNLIHIDSSSTADRYVTPVLEPAALSLLQGAPKTVFQQDKSWL